ncbi:MAG: hypothetical protein JO287_20985 [Pseudonocardiales bacterium]|nr:hypothetical protein [Pseudonocardiales bacterium]
MLRILYASSSQAELRDRLSKKDAELNALKTFRAEALSRLAAQHEEITTLRQQIQARPTGALHRLPSTHRPC